jgi:hypothetical protein
VLLPCSDQHERDRDQAGDGRAEQQQIGECAVWIGDGGALLGTLGIAIADRGPDPGDVHQ